ncbi:uncharacterized protein Z519_02526 [Cladophialophora bantiana CBS 173.52]|uniref:Transmembrane protein n=1 Tax=Cladophialophora bantiana (strain ATCC 10958 / CBS 173.52 / CDC B-1940 / NIH 8579) TaxID=1442370 RepID=A0A0D2IK02_CLAB1|nr:uncharacterized protein Z519_02526 [Cladophialophora bantiana CBS 173.52]KIW97134.1 hypothetical protein Z519_02526 [Cladophialophora bantiana CBS 173.52]
MKVKSRSAIPLFVFLAIAMFFVPCAILVFICFHRTYRRKVDEKSRGEVTGAVAESMPNWTVPIELGNIQPLPPQPPPVAKILPIRSWQTRKSRHLSTRHSAIEGMNTLFEKRSPPNAKDVAAPTPTRPGQRHSMTAQNMQEYLAAEQSPQNPFDDPVTARSSPLHNTTTHYSLPAALVTEQSPAEIQVRRVAERSAAFISEAPRVKSQIAKHEHAVAATSPSPRVPSVNAACYGPPRQVPKAWI